MKNGSRSGQTASYQDLIVWQRAMDLVDCVYEITGRWPALELFGLTSQVRQAVVSVPASIAEGQSRNKRKEFVHHLGSARGSLSETETLLLIGFRQRYLTDFDLNRLLSQSTEVGKLLRSLLQSLSKS